LIAGGNLGMPGAARLAAEAAYRCGAGLVSVATRPEHAPHISAACPELISHGIESPADLRPLLQRATVVAVGPGLGQDQWSRLLFEGVMESRLPAVVDADALNLLAGDPRQRSDWVLTPHPGEAGRLLARSSQQVQNDRLQAVGELVDRYRGVVVLKGAGTLVNSGDGAPVSVCDAGNPGMATGGMGDILTGAVAALLAQGVSALDAARIGVWVHGHAADRLCGRGEIGLMSRDLLPAMRDELNRLVRSSAG
jgi:NAD(P)H-hydrate epimerase